MAVFFDSLESRRGVGDRSKYRSDLCFRGAFHVELDRSHLIDDRLLHVRILEHLTGFFIIDDALKPGHALA